MESLKNIISDIRVFLYGGITTLPLSIAGTMLILGLFTANLSILFFLIGFLILTPLLSSILNLALTTVFGGSSLFKAKTSDICKLVIPYSTLNSPATISDTTTILSPWMAMISFFVGYLFTNALELYNRTSTDVTINISSSSQSDISSKVANRKTQAMVAIMSIIIVGLIVLGFRFYTGCESTLGMIITFILFVFAGNGWFNVLGSVGQDRLSDLFGIANRLLPPGALANGPIACIPIPA